MATVNLNELPQSILDQIPLSIQVNGPIYELDLLPLKIKYLVQNYKNIQPESPKYKNVYDIKDELSIYQDCKTIESKKELIKTYFNNFLQVRIGQYPFDVTEGCRLKEHLQTKDTSLRQTLIGNDIQRIVGVLGRDYDINIKILKVNITPIRSNIQGAFSHVNEEIQIYLQVEGEDSVVNLK